MNIKMKHFAWFIIILLLSREVILIIRSSIHDYNDKLWQPYHSGDSLEFVSNRGDTAKWVIHKILKSNNVESTLFFYNDLMMDTNVKINEFSSIVFIRTVHGVTSVFFEPEFRRGEIRIIKDEKNPQNLKTIRYNQMELFKITPHEKDVLVEPFLQAIYWSPQYGYIKVIYSDGLEWELSSFTRHGNVLY